METANVGRPRYETRHITGLTTTPPGVRTVVVVGYHLGDEDDEGEFMINPVVAIQSQAYYRFTSRAEKSPGISFDPAGLIANGWKYQGHCTADTVLIAQGMDLVCPEDSFLENGDPYAIVACPWPEEEDDRRLAEVGAELVAIARERAAKPGEKASSIAPARQLA